MGRAERVVQNTGQEVHGDVYAERLVFNVGGHALPVWDMDVEQLEAMRAEIERAVRTRTAQASFLNYIFFFTLLVFWSAVPIGVASTRLEVGQALPLVLAMVAVPIVGIWHVSRYQFGHWRRRNKAAIDSHERALASLDAELDLRNPRGHGLAPFLKAMVEPFDARYRR